jgi:hypothetical protein
MSEQKLSISNILYDTSSPDNNEFKFWFFENHVNCNPFRDPSVPLAEISVDIYMLPVMYLNGRVEYGHG